MSHLVAFKDKSTREKQETEREKWRKKKKGHKREKRRKDTEAISKL